ncbi:hypothetical protein HUB94_10680 [Paenibacillus cellulosilyticus]|nr:hypothetical protein [Paenibacillus cellulosilyticus]QKS44825.1 hypothetical protein HUB94_10680 [Paenibacillus cellulosilyticus]
MSDSMKRMNDFVGDLKQSLDQMKGITSLVKEIADQTAEKLNTQTALL